MYILFNKCPVYNYDNKIVYIQIGTAIIVRQSIHVVTSIKCRYWKTLKTF